MLMDRKRLQEITAAFKTKRVAVAGDFFLDRIFNVDRGLDEPSVETGLTAYQVVSRNMLPGAAGVITNNLFAFGVEKIYSVALLGDDGEAFDLIKGLQATRVDTQYMVRSAEVFTPTYTKTFFDYSHGLEETHRIDIRNRKATPESAERQLIDNFYALAEKIDLLICLEQLKNSAFGVFTPSVLEALQDIAKLNPEMIIMADSRYNITGFKHMTIKCNDVEAVRAVYPKKGINNSDEISDSLVSDCLRVLSGGMDKPVFVTCGSKGAKIIEDGVVMTVPAHRVEGPIDICGAGDSATCAIATSLSAGASPSEAALLGNLVASITIQQLGVTGIATIPQLHARFDEYTRAVVSK